MTILVSPSRSSRVFQGGGRRGLGSACAAVGNSPVPSSPGDVLVVGFFLGGCFVLFFNYGCAHKLMWRLRKENLERKWADPLFLLFELCSKSFKKE